MAKKQNSAPADLIKSTEDLLKEIGNLNAEIHSTEALYNADILAVSQAYASHLKDIQDRQIVAEKKLLSVMCKYKRTLFAESDIKKLVNGILMREAGKHVVIPKDALDACEKQGFIDAIKIVKSIKREVVEKWTDEKLFLIGAERKPDEKFSYEVIK